MVSDRRALGERLKRQRERAGVTLARISQNTKVPVALFTGLEAGDCSRWPTGLFARAYVRGYAEAIGLNADETVEEFLAAFGAVGHADGVEAGARAGLEDAPAAPRDGRGVGRSGGDRAARRPCGHRAAARSADCRDRACRIRHERVDDGRIGAGLLHASAA